MTSKASKTSKTSVKSVKAVKASRIAAAGAVAGTAVLALSSPAFAHVSVQPEGAAVKGGYAVVDFKVPNERDDASTTKLEVTFPTEYPLASVLPEPISGWTVKVTRSKPAKPVETHGETITEAVTKVTWTATGKGVEPGYFQKFPVSVGMLPTDADQLVFKALQTYSDNDVVRWIEVRKDGQEEPENPAPVLELSTSSTAGSTAEDASDTSDTSDTSGITTAAGTPASPSGTDTTARVLGVVGIVVGATGVAYGVLAGRRRTTA